METPEIKLHVASESGELLIRTGEALPIYDPRQVDLIGTIAAPGDWYENRREKLDPLAGHVLAHYTNRQIVLRLDERDHFSTTITGTLKLHPELVALHINEPSYYWSHGQLYRLLQFKGAYFKSPDQHKSILDGLRQFSVRVEKDIQNANDYKGSSASSTVQKIKLDMNLYFPLSIPIFAGEANDEFNVEICVDIIGGEVKFWLESVQLYEMMIVRTQDIFESQLDRLKAFAIVKQY